MRKVRIAVVALNSIIVCWGGCQVCFADTTATIVFDEIVGNNNTYSIYNDPMLGLGIGVGVGLSSSGAKSASISVTWGVHFESTNDYYHMPLSGAPGFAFNGIWTGKTSCGVTLFSSGYSGSADARSDDLWSSTTYLGTAGSTTDFHNGSLRTEYAALPNWSWNGSKWVSPDWTMPPTDLSSDGSLVGPSYGYPGFAGSGASIYQHY